MTDTMDRLDMTLADLAPEPEVCVNCHDDVDEFGHYVEGWGDLCEHCYGDLWGARLAQAF